MIHDPAYIKELLQKQVKGTATPGETALVLLAFDLYSEEEITEMFTRIDLSGNDEDLRQYWPPPPEEEVKQWIQQKKEAAAKDRRRRYRIVALVYGGFFVWAGLLVGLVLSQKENDVFHCGYIGSRNTEISTAPYSVRIRLGNHAVLTIDSTGRGEVAKDGPFRITTPQPGLLVYSRAGGAEKKGRELSLYHTIATTNSSQYRVVLPDGTTVRLNAASVLHFPLSFSDTSRRVELQGEALFNVAPHRQPFVVQLAEAEISGSGSRFNVKAYTPAAVTTLLEGNLQVKRGRTHLQLDAGEEALFETAPGGKVLGRLLRRTADTAQAVSWKGVQRFYTNAPLREIVADMARWYNLRIGSIACVPDRRFTAGICYNAPLEEVWSMFRKMGLYFVAQGNSITFCHPPPGPGLAMRIGE
ncbi:MAG TPA: FecR domain-containing protein [Flavisolibacter sp.]|jgi:hypothetical protein|nr:FecR domain-containing protein [Flavisolibacter sp.]